MLLNATHKNCIDDMRLLLNGCEVFHSIILISKWVIIPKLFSRLNQSTLEGWTVWLRKMTHFVMTQIALCREIRWRNRKLLTADKSGIAKWDPTDTWDPIRIDFIPYQVYQFIPYHSVLKLASFRPEIFLIESYRYIYGILFLSPGFLSWIIIPLIAK